MAAVSIRGLDDQVRERLRVRAARNGRSMEAETRTILVEAVGEPNEQESLFTPLLLLGVARTGPRPAPTEHARL
ncbi:MAG: FitA-like ribbon-helix-helix domain-containing protein [Acidimicrobiales bacterium]